eukprot:s7606_g3.t1
MCEHLILQSFIIHLIIPNSGWNSSGCCLHRQLAIVGLASFRSTRDGGSAERQGLPALPHPGNARVAGPQGPTGPKDVGGH